MGAFKKFSCQNQQKKKADSKEEEVIGSTCLLFFTEAADANTRLHKWKSGFKAI